MYFIRTSDDTWMPCGPKQSGAVQTTMQDLAAQGLASKVDALYTNASEMYILSSMLIAFAFLFSNYFLGALGSYEIDFMQCINKI